MSAGGVMGCCGANVDLKRVFRPVSSLGSGSIRGSINSCCACEVSRCHKKLRIYDDAWWAKQWFKSDENVLVRKAVADPLRSACFWLYKGNDDLPAPLCWCH